MCRKRHTDRALFDSRPHGKDWQTYFKNHKPAWVPREVGVPQGRVLSGMLANLYLHELDRWVVEEPSATVDLRHYRYTDDFVILTRSEDDAEALFDPVDMKLREDLKLPLHPDPPKTNRSVEISRRDLQFVGSSSLKTRSGLAPQRSRSSRIDSRE